MNYQNNNMGDSQTLSNNDDSRLGHIYQSFYQIDSRYYYDHLGQRVLKEEPGDWVYVYDLFGNLIGEYNPNTVAKRQWVYLGSQRLAMIAMPGTGGGGHGAPFPGCQGLPEPPDICGLAGLQNGGDTTGSETQRGQV